MHVGKNIQIVKKAECKKKERKKTNIKEKEKRKESVLLFLFTIAYSLVFQLLSMDGL